MSYDLSQFHQTFFEESKEHLENMERLLVAIDVSNPDPEQINAIFRAAHSVKGGANTFGFSDMADVTHVLETVLDLVRHGKLALTNEIIDVSLDAGDVIAQQLRGHREGFDVPPEVAQAVIVHLKRIELGEPAPETETLAPASPAVARANAELSCFRISIHAGMLSAEQEEALLEEFKQSGSATASALEAGGRLIKVQTSNPQEEVESVLGLLLSPEQYSIEASMAEDIEPPSSAEADDLEGDGFGFFVDPKQFKAKEEEEQGFGFFVDLPSTPATTQASTAEAAVTAAVSAAAVTAADMPRRRASDVEAETSIRVSVEKVDQLINMVGELVITNAMLAQTVATVDPVLFERLIAGMGQLERNSRDLQEAVMSIRMLPIGTVFSRFPRLVRELSSKIGKGIDLKLIGESTELDKGLIEKLSDPLTHLVRNSLDHGIEMPEQRAAAGKPARGTLTLHAYHQGGDIFIEVNDDGAGLNRAKILAKAKEQGVPHNPDAPDSEIWPLIFAPGFSTAEVVTDISGRGVGMDVVKRNIEGMGGRVEIRSQTGIGTSILIRLPLTMAILDGLSVGVGEQIYIVPINAIVESMQPKLAEISTVSGKGRVVHVRGEYLPLVALHEVFNVVPRTATPCQGIVVILEIEGGKVALFVDELLSQHQVVIKSLETNYRKVLGVSGATIMGDGRVALILDVAALIQLSRNGSKSETEG